MTQKNVSVVIVNMNGFNVLVPCLKSVFRNLKNIMEIIIIDNNSHDESREFLQKLSQKSKMCKVIYNNDNRGFAEANNQGYDVAIGKYVLFLNNDTVVSDSFLDPLVQLLQNEKAVAAVQPAILFPDGTVDSVGSYMTPTGFLYHKAHRQTFSKKRLPQSEVYSLKGACMLWRKSVLDEIGCFDETYFAYFEETDLCHRAFNRGYSLLYSPESSIEHLGGFTSNSMNQAFIQYHNTKNRITTYIVHNPFNYLILMLPLHLLLTEALVCKTLFSNMHVAIEIQKGMILGIWKGLRKRDYLRKKRDLRRILKKPDISYYLALFSSLKGYEQLW